MSGSHIPRLSSTLKLILFIKYSRTPVTRTLKGKKQFEVVRNSGNRGKFQWKYCDQGKGNLVQVSGDFTLSKFKLLRFYCTIKIIECLNIVTLNIVSVTSWLKPITSRHLWTSSNLRLLPRVQTISCRVLPPDWR